MESQLQQRPAHQHIEHDENKHFPAGGKEAGVLGSLIHKFDHLNVGDESEANLQQPERKPFTGSHDQFNPESESNPKSFDSNTKERMPPSDTVTGKVSSAISDKAIYAKNVLASKLGYGGGSGQEALSPSSNKPESESTPGYTQRITQSLNPVYDKVAGAGTAVMSKFQGRGDAAAPAATGKGYWADKLKPGDEDKALSEAITQSLNPVYEKVAGAGTAVMSKFQSGGETGKQEGLSPPNKPESESTSQKITQTLNPVYEKVAGAGTDVMSKFQSGGETGKQGDEEGISPSNKPESESTPGYTQRITQSLNPVYDKVAGAGTDVMSKFQGSGDTAPATDSSTDKGVSAKHYLKPVDEDKALSEAITDALHKKKERNSQKTGEEKKPLGKVTESEQVATHLGSGIEGKREGEDAFDAGRVKDAFGSWIGKGTGTQTAQDSINETYVDKPGEKQRDATKMKL